MIVSSLPPYLAKHLLALELPFKANDKFNGSKTLSDKEKGNASKPFMRRCFICGSNQHMKSACPRRSQYRPDRTTGRGGQGHAQVHTCTAGTGTAQEWAGSDRLDSDSRLRCAAGSSVESDQPSPLPALTDSCQHTQGATTFEQICNADTTDVTEMPINKISERSVDSILADGWSELHYVEVGIEGLPNTVMALDDSGAQLCVVRRDVIDPLYIHLYSPIW